RAYALWQRQQGAAQRGGRQPGRVRRQRRRPAHWPVAAVGARRCPMDARTTAPDRGDRCAASRHRRPRGQAPHRAAVAGQRMAAPVAHRRGRPATPSAGGLAHPAWQRTGDRAGARARTGSRRAPRGPLRHRPARHLHARCAPPRLTTGSRPPEGPHGHDPVRPARGPGQRRQLRPRPVH
ncbi:hypothetical protein OY671_009693, partial [Metschnikowia pulcherrima]